MTPDGAPESHPKSPASAFGPGGARMVCTVHGWAHVRAACVAAQRVGAPLTLLSPPGCARAAGAGWFKALIDRARAAFPSLDIVGMLDCGNAAGRALQAMAHGVTHLVVDPDSPALARLRDIAAQRGASLTTHAPDSIDLGLAADPDAACRDALATARPHGVAKASGTR